MRLSQLIPQREQRALDGPSFPQDRAPITENGWWESELTLGFGGSIEPSSGLSNS